MIKRFIPIFLCLIMTFSFGGVYATWQYAEASPTPYYQGMNITISEFNYSFEEILPGGGEGTGEVQIGENHFAIINLIVDEAGKGYDLNSSGSLIHSLLKQDDVVYANQKVSGGNLKFVLDVANNTHMLYYCVEKSSDTLYYIYTFSINDLSTAIDTDIEIAVYRTTVVKTDIWRAGDSHLGYAKTISLRSLGVSASSQSIGYTIDVSQWHL